MISLMEKNQLIKVTLFVTIFCLLIAQGCRKSDSHYVEINRYSSGELLSKIPFLKVDSLKDGIYKEYYRNGNLKKLISFKKGQPVDSAMQYFDSGQLEFKEIRNADTIFTFHYLKTGELSAQIKFLNTPKPIEIGWSVFYNKDGSVADSIEHINLKTNSYLNQRIKYNKKNHLIIDSSNFFKFSLKSIQNSDLFDLKINYVPMDKKSDVFMVIGEDIKEDFSNIDNVELDTIFMQNNKITSKAFEKASKVFKGFFYEYRSKEFEANINDSTKFRIYEKKTFFNELVVAKNP